MHSSQHIPKKASIDFKSSGKLITLLLKSEEIGSQTQQDVIWNNSKERNLPTAEGTKVLMTTNFHRDGCPCERSNRKLKVIKQTKGHSFVSTPHCELVPKGTDWWIRDLKSARGTFVNGTKLSENGEKKLDDLDIISLGVSHMDPEILNFVERESEDDEGDAGGGDVEYCKEAPQIVYRYKSPILRNTEPKEDEESINLVKLDLESHLLKAVTENELIIFSILGKLPVSDLKNARLVCKKWENASTKWLYSCTRVDVPGLDCPHWSYLIDNYDSYFKGKGIQRVSLDLNEKSTPVRCSQSFVPNQEKDWEVKGQLYLENVHWFLNNFGRGIKSFHLNFRIDCRNWSLFIRIFKELLTVEDLQLSFKPRISNDDMLKEMKFPEEMPKLSSVKSLSILINDLHTGALEELMVFRKKFEPVLVGLLSIFPSVEKLTLPDPLLMKSMEICLDIVKDSTILTPRVNDIPTKLVDSFRQENVEILPEIPFVYNLRNLELDNLTDCTSTIPNHVMSFLRKTAPYLETLTLGLRGSNTFINSLIVEGSGFPFPEFPKLWRLKIMTMNRLSVLHELDHYCGVHYANVFPNLKSLKFGGMLSNPLTESHLEHFLRVESGPCLTVVEFEMNITSTVEMEPVELRQRVSEKFPNVDLPRIKFSLEEDDDDDDDDEHAHVVIEYYVDGTKINKYAASDSEYDEDYDHHEEEDEFSDDDDYFNNEEDVDESDDDNFDHDEDEDEDADYWDHNDGAIDQICQHQ